MYSILLYVWMDVWMSPMDSHALYDLDLQVFVAARWWYWKQIGFQNWMTLVFVLSWLNLLWYPITTGKIDTTRCLNRSISFVSLACIWSFPIKQEVTRTHATQIGTSLAFSLPWSTTLHPWSRSRVCWNQFSACLGQFEYWTSSNQQRRSRLKSPCVKAFLALQCQKMSEMVNKNQQKAQYQPYALHGIL